MAWRPVGKRVRCELHDEEFARGAACPSCGPGDAVDEEPAIAPKAAPGAESVAEHEAAFCAVARAAAVDADAAAKVIRGDIAELRSIAADLGELAENATKPGPRSALLALKLGAIAKAADLEVRLAAARNEARGLAIRARRAAAERAQRREDWVETARLEKIVREIRHRGTAAAGSVSEARH